MIYRKLGNTGLDISVVGFGGEWLNGLPENEVCELLYKAAENGMNYLDVFLPHSEARTNIGKALKQIKNKMMIQGHFCTVFEDGQYTRTRDLEKTKAAFDDLLSRLQTDYIDVGMIHYVDSFEDYEAVHKNGIADYVIKMKETGVIGHIGLSSHNPEVALRAIEDGLTEVLMFSINPAYDLQKADTDIYELMEFKGLSEKGWIVDPARQKLYTACENKGVGITVMKALGAGSLLKAERSPFGKALSVSGCIQYSLDRPGVSSVLVGFKTPQEIDESLYYCKAGEDEKDYSHIYDSCDKLEMTGRCMYCNHCQPCAAHIDIGEVTKFLDLALMSNEVPETLLKHYKALEHNAADCIECGACEPNCPFGVRIMENMKKAREIFS